MLPHGGQEPVAERRVRLHHPAADEVRVRIGEVRRDGEQGTERPGLLGEDLPGQLVAPLAVAAYQLRRPLRRLTGQCMPREAGQPVRQQIVLDRGQRHDALDVTGEPAGAGRHRLSRCQHGGQRNLHVPQFAGHPRRPGDHPAVLDQATTQSGADDRRHRRAPHRVGPEMNVMGVERGRVAVVVVDHRQPQPTFEGTPDVVAAPGRLGEVRGPLRRDDAAGTGRAGGVQTDRADLAAGHPGEGQHAVEGVRHRRHRRLRALLHEARRLHQAIDQEPSVEREHGGVVGRATVVDPDHHRRAVHPSSASHRHSLT